MPNRLFHMIQVSLVVFSCLYLFLFNNIIFRSWIRSSHYAPPKYNCSASSAVSLKETPYFSNRVISRLSKLCALPKLYLSTLSNLSRPILNDRRFINPCLCFSSLSLVSIQGKLYSCTSLNPIGPQTQAGETPVKYSRSCAESAFGISG